MLFLWWNFFNIWVTTDLNGKIVPLSFSLWDFFFFCWITFVFTHRTFCVVNCFLVSFLSSIILRFLSHIWSNFFRIFCLFQGFFLFWSCQILFRQLIQASLRFFFLQTFCFRLSLMNIFSLSEYCRWPSTKLSHYSFLQLWAWFFLHNWLIHLLFSCFILCFDLVFVRPLRFFTRFLHIVISASLISKWVELDIFLIHILQKGWNCFFLQARQIPFTCQLSANINEPHCDLFPIAVETQLPSYQIDSFWAHHFQTEISSGQSIDLIVELQVFQYHRFLHFFKDLFAKGDQSVFDHIWSQLRIVLFHCNIACPCKEVIQDLIYLLLSGLSWGLFGRFWLLSPHTLI